MRDLLGSGDSIRISERQGRWEYLDKYLLQLINSYLEQNKIRKQWKIFYVTSIYKKGNSKDPENYTEINVNRILNKFFAKIVHNKLQRALNISLTRNGFSPDWGCMDNLFIVQQLIKMRIAKEEETHMIWSLLIWKKYMIQSPGIERGELCKSIILIIAS